MNLQTNCFYTFQPVKTGDKCCAFLLFISKKELLCSLMFVISVQDSYEEFAYSELSIKRVGVVAGQKGWSGYTTFMPGMKSVLFLKTRDINGIRCAYQPPEC